MTFPILALSFLFVVTASIGASLRTGRYFAFGMIGSTLLLALHGRVYANYMVDDAYIYFRYAENLANGHGPVWNPGQPPVEGYTGILWLLPLTLASWLHMDLSQTARYLGFVLSIGTLALLYPLARALSGDGPARLAPVLAAVGLAASPFAVWTFGGLETPLFTFLVLLGVSLILREESRDEPGFPWSGAVFAFAAMTRPEGLLFAFVSGTYKLISASRRDQRSTAFAWLAVWAASFAALYGSYFAWRYSYYGYLLPNTFYAKVGTGSGVYRRGLNYLADDGYKAALPFLLAGTLLYALTSRKRLRSSYVVLLVAAWLVWVVLSGGDSLEPARFLVPIWPLLLLLAATGFLSFRSPSGFPRVTIGQAATSLVMFGAIVFVPLYASGSIAPVLRFDRQKITERIEIGRWMRVQLPPDTTIAVTSAGALPYYSRLPALDMLGLNDAHIAHVTVPTSVYAGHEKYDIAYVLNRRPDLIFLAARLSGSPWLTPQAYREQPWLFPDDRLLVNDDRTFELYVPASADLGGGRWLNVLISRTAASRLAVFHAAR